MQRIRFQDREWLLVGDMENGEAIATPEAFASFRPSYAHLYYNGDIYRHLEKIGTREDIEFLGEAETIEPDKGAALRAILNRSFNEPLGDE